MSQHWYDKNGQLHECDLREARKNNLVPSVTTIIHEFTNSYGLELYKSKQMFIASLTLPRPDGITDEDFFQLVKEDSEQHSEKAKEFGVNVHVNIRGFLIEENPILYGSNLAIKNAMKVRDWIKSNKDSVIVDFKTQETKDGKFKSPYNDWLFQLCAYDNNNYHMKAGEYIEHSFNFQDQYGGTIDYSKLHGSLRDKIKLANIMISSNEDIPIKVYEWSEDKIKWGHEVFTAMVRLFRILKKLN